ALGRPCQEGFGCRSLVGHARPSLLLTSGNARNGYRDFRNSLRIPRKEQAANGFKCESNHGLHGWHGLEKEDSANRLVQSAVATLKSVVCRVVFIRAIRVIRGSFILRPVSNPVWRS